MINQHILTDHGRKRLRQRGVQHLVAETIIDHADLDLDVGDGCSAIRMSADRVGELRAAAEPAFILDRAVSLALIVAEDGAVITALKGNMARDVTARARRRNRRWGQANA